MIYPNPIFIGGPHRSGTGMLRAIIGANSAIAIPPKEYMFFDLLGAPAGLVQNDPGELLQTVLAWPKVGEWNLRNDQVALEPSDMNMVRSVYSAPLVAYAHAQGKPRFGEKTPFLERYFDVLLDWFGTSMRFLHIIRDPVRTFYSSIHYRGFVAPPTLELFALQWKLSLLQGLRCSRRFPQSYMLLRYEDLIANPIGCTEAICKFCALPREIDHMLHQAKAEHARNSSFRQIAGSMESTGRTPQSRHTLSVQKMLRIERIVFPSANAMGYTAHALGAGE